MSDRPTTADELRRAFIDFFVARGHTEVPSASVIPVDKSLLFTIAGMVPFKSYFVGEETPPYKRATSSQKCMRAGGKQNDLDDIGRTNRHFSFFEMLGNFSFGDYFKAEAIHWAMELYRDVLKFDTSRLWVTVHEDDDEAERIWRDDEGFPADRIQRLGEANWWSMGDTGPCGPSSEIFWDLGPEYGPPGGPATDHDRYIEIWNLVFMTYDQRADGTRVPLPKPSIDTGAGLERNLLVAQGHTSIWDIDVFRPLIARAEELTGVRYGDTEATDISLRIVAEHARAMTFVIADGVRPSNNERGYVLRRIIRRAVLHSYLLGARDLVLPAMIDVAVDVMGAAYPEIVAGRETVAKVVEREEKAFRATLQRGVEMLGELLDQGDVSGRDAFFLHDTLGFPIDLTREIAGVRDRGVDLDDFDRRMTQQRERARAAADEAGAAAGDSTVWREVLDEFGPTEFTGRREAISKAKVIALVVGGEPVDQAGEGMAVEVALDRTPFYAESGGQVGDTGTITTLSDPKANRTVLEVRDTRYGIAGSVVVHECTVRTGTIQVDDEVEAAIDEVRRDRIRRNHTATHILHWALREVLGAHVQQAGSMVAPDRLRFDFSHHDAVTPDQLAQVERLANLQVISDAPVRHYETTKAEAERIGAIAFFGEKYGEIVRVLEAGPSTELCGGTHVHALGFIGPIKIVSESSIGSNLRRIEAVTGDGAFEYIEQEEELLRRAGSLLRAAPKEVPEKIERLSEQVRTLQEELQKLKAKEAVSAAADLATEAHDGAVVQRHDGLSNEELRRLAQETVRALGSGVVALAGTGPDGVKAGIAVAVSKDLVERGVSADAIARPAAKALGGGVGKGADAVVGGGPNAAGIDEALQLVRDQAATWKT
ncbi:MAG: alanyl-tRNA synthetase [Actinomycetota bacterium]|nr:alanyl-tRNA synthetase [Actinomycetota bacterium]